MTAIQKVHRRERPKVRYDASLSARLAPPLPQACLQAILQPLASPAAMRAALLQAMMMRLRVSATRACASRLRYALAVRGTRHEFPFRRTLATATRRATPTSAPPTPKDCGRTALARST